MKKYAFILGVMLLSTAQFAFAQITVSGKVYDAGVKQPLAGVNIIVKGKVLGTVTDANGNFSLTVNEQPPITLSFSFIGFETQEVVIDQNQVSDLTINLQEQSLLGQEIVVSASRVEETILESPVSIEKMGILAVQNTASDNYYKAIANLKGVDVASSSINFQIINARGFASTGNTRFVQLIDGMDTQAPALNFPIGNLNGPSELDVESVELIPGASSALYGPNAFNGILLITSKSPFEYQGLSAMAKLGVNHVDADYEQDASPMYEASIRYAKAFNNKFAFKVNFSYMRAQDWHGTSDYDRNSELNPFPGQENISADRLHYMGDEAAINLAIFQLSSAWQIPATHPDLGFFGNAINDPNSTTNALMYAGDLPNHVVSVTPYKEVDLIDYGAENTKFNAGLYYRLTDDLELSYLANYGWGTSIYTGAQRYSLSNFSIGQHRLQLRGDNFFVRTYATLENSGDSYITEFLAKRVNDLSVQQNSPISVLSDVSGYLATYGIEYLRHLYNEGLAPGDIQTRPDRLQIQQEAHDYARQVTDGYYHLDPNSENFEQIKEQALEGVVPFGPKFNDKTRLYHAEAQYDFKNEIDFMELQAGASYRMFDLNSNGTIFDDQGGISIKEYGAYAQAGKWIAADKLKLVTSLRYDKNQNFDGQFNPRISAVFKLAENHNIRASYQTGFRIPTTQGQYIDLDILTARLLGGLPQMAEKYDITTDAYTGASIRAFTQNVFNLLAQGESREDAIASSSGLLVPFTEFDPVKPEKVKSIEIGYKSLISNRLMIDAAYYYNIYNDFITQIQVRKDNIPGQSLLNGTSKNTYQIYTNFDQQISSQGAVLGLTYNLPSDFTLSGNYSWNVINDEIEDGLTEFNTPEHKVNFSFGNRKLTDNLGFKVTYRWQDAFVWESSFAQGPVPAYSTLDAQVSYKLSSLKSILKVGASNLLNKYYIQSLGGPQIGGIYYVSLTFNELMN